MNACLVESPSYKSQHGAAHGQDLGNTIRSYKMFGWTEDSARDILYRHGLRDMTLLFCLLRWIRPKFLNSSHVACVFLLCCWKCFPWVSKPEVSVRGDWRAHLCWFWYQITDGDRCDGDTTGYDPWTFATLFTASGTSTYPIANVRIISPCTWYRWGTVPILFAAVLYYYNTKVLSGQ